MNHHKELRKSGFSKPFLGVAEPREMRALRLANEQLQGRVRAEEARNWRLSQIISIQEEERRRFARDLHDGIGQSLTVLMLGLCIVEEAPTMEGARERTAGLRRIAASAAEEVRRLARGLRPTALVNLSIEAAWADGSSLSIESRPVRGVADSACIPLA
jgi:signal transduction histidine kinase